LSYMGKPQSVQRKSATNRYQGCARGGLYTSPEEEGQEDVNMNLVFLETRRRKSLEQKDKRMNVIRAKGQGLNEEEKENYHYGWKRSP